MQITKTDYLNFKFCRKNLWLQKNRPDEFPRDQLSEFELELVKEGQEVDDEAHNLFPDGINIDGDQDVAVAETKYRLDNMDGNSVIFQAAIKLDPYYIRTDILKYNEEKEGWELYEVKATTKVKREKFNNHIYDLAFQYNVCKLFGLNIISTGVIHLNNEYKRDGDIDYNQLFNIEDVTEEVLEVAESVQEDMNLMISYLEGSEEKYCECRYKTRGNHCTTFSYSNPDVPDYSVHDITRISGKKLSILVDDNILDVKEVPEEMEFSDNQKLQIQSAQMDKVIKDDEEIEGFLSNIQYPIYFLDYESYLPAIPWFNRYAPYQNIVFQYSLHIIKEEGGEVLHREFLATESKDPSLDLVESLREDIPEDNGTVLVWHKPFEMGRNRELAGLNPKYDKYMSILNDRIIDLKEIFSKSMYVHPKFKGSASIKKVLPVLVPELSYDNLSINNGADANKKWGKMIKGECSEEECDQIKKDLLVYCKQDTFAMVRIWEEMKKLLS